MNQNTIVVNLVFVGIVNAAILTVFAFDDVWLWSFFLSGYLVNWLIFVSACFIFRGIKS